MSNRDIVVIGASAGGLEAVSDILSALPKDLGAAIFVVVHGVTASFSKVLERVCALPVAPAVDGDPIEPNRVYCGIPDWHLMLEGNRVRLSHGPRESRARPSIDVLFRSAAFTAGPRVIGVVLTGMLDDGTAGLWAIKDRGGVAIVQSPDEAQYPSMPRSALRHVEADHVVTLAEIPKLLVSLTQSTPTASKGSDMPNHNIEIETRIALEDNAFELGVRGLGSPSFYTCPECHGSMVAIKEGTFTRYRCHTGHAFSPMTLADISRDQIEKTIYAALAQTEERAALLVEMEHTLRDQPDGEKSAARYASEREKTQGLKTRLRELLGDFALQREDPDSE